MPGGYDWLRRQALLAQQQPAATNNRAELDPEFVDRFKEYLQSRSDRIPSHPSNAQDESDDSGVKSLFSHTSKQVVKPWPLASEPSFKKPDESRHDQTAAPSQPNATSYQQLPEAWYKAGNASTDKPLPLVAEESVRRASYNKDLPPRPQSTHSRMSLQRLSQRLSMTPIDFQYPSQLLEEGDAKAAEALGLEARQNNDNPDIPMSDMARPTSILSPATAMLEPMNGRAAWLQAVAAFLVVFNCWGFSNAFGLYQAYYARVYIPDTSASTIAYIGSTQLALVFGLGVPIGRAVDAGYFRWAFHGGSLVMIVGLFGTSWCKTWIQLWFVQGLLVGLGMGCVFCSGLVCLMGWFDERKMGLAMGFAAAGSCVGGIVYILLSRHLLLPEGFGTTIRTLSGMALATMIPPNIIFRMRVKPKRRAQRTTKKGITLSMFWDPAYIAAGIGLFCSFLGLYFGFVYMISYAAEVLRLNDTRATNILIYMLVTNLPGRIIPALISDKWLGPLNTMIPSVICSAAVLGAWISQSNHKVMPQESLTAIACVYGFISAGVQSLYAPVTYSFCLEKNAADNAEPRAAIDRMGLKAGAIFTFIGIACLIGTPIGGNLITSNDDGSPDFLGAQIFSALAMLFGAVFLAISRVLKVGFRLRRA